MKYFDNCSTLDDLKAEYNRLTAPGPGPETMKAILHDHDEKFEQLLLGTLTSLLVSHTRIRRPGNTD